MATLSPVSPKYFTSKGVHNMILLGESGAGKSTFINAIANYLSYVTFEFAKQNELKILVGTSLGYVDNNGEYQTLNAREDDNEGNKELGDSKTQLPKSYKLYLGQDVWVRIIDTPGINDTRGKDQDKENLETIMKIIDACKEISAICVVMKPDVTRMNAQFIDCLNQVFSHLHQSITANLVFIFTNGKGVNYEPIDAQAIVNKFFRDRGIQIKLTQENTNCFENDPFNYLLAVRHKIRSNVTDPVKSWKTSYEVSKKLINNILNLEPHNVKNTVNINKTRHLIEKLTIELSRITEYIGNCLNYTDQSIKEVVRSETIKELENMKRKPQYVCETVKLDKPKLVCMSKNCTRIDKNGNTCYPQVCCPDCSVMAHMKGHGQHVKFAPKMLFGKRFCSRCYPASCFESSHKIIFFETKLVLKNNTGSNETSDTVIGKSRESLKSDLLMKLEFEYKTNYEERNAIIKALALFCSYMKGNTIIEFEDIFEAQNLAKMTKFGQNCDEFEATKEVLQLYAKEKSLLDKQSGEVMLKDLEDTRFKLCALYFNGENIKNIYTQLDSSLGGTDISDEICIDVPFFNYDNLLISSHTQQTFNQ